VRLIIPALYLVSWLLALPAAAQEYPNKPIRLLVGYSPGGSVDASARLIAERLGPMLGQTVVVENKPGATGNIAADMLARSAPDGYTIYMATSINAVSVSLFKTLGYHPVRDFASISKVVSVPNVLVVHPKVPAKNVQEFVAYAKANPGKLSAATTGPGSSPHLCVALLSSLTGIKIVDVPYKGGSQVMPDLLSGQVDLSFSNPTSVIQHAEKGGLRILAVTTATRFSQMPNTPTMIESGYPEFDLSGWYGLAAPAGTPKAIVDKLNAAVTRILKQPDVVNALVVQGLEAMPSTPAEMADTFSTDIVKYAKLLKDSGVEPQ